MNTTIDLTVGDILDVPGTITQYAFAALANTGGCGVKFSLLRTDGGVPIVNEAAATIVALNNATSSVDVSYRLQAADTANAVSQAIVRWKFLMADGGIIHAPGPRDQQTIIRINA